MPTAYTTDFVLHNRKVNDVMHCGLSNRIFFLFFWSLDAKCFRRGLGPLGRQAFTRVNKSGHKIAVLRHAKRQNMPWELVLRSAPAALGCLVACCGQLRGQEAVRWSLAGETAATRRGGAYAEPCSLRLGPTLWKLSGGLSLEANDNIRFADAEREADLTLRPQLNTRVDWKVSPQNSLSFSLGTGYSAYALHPQFNRFFVGPGSELVFNLYAGDFWIDFHDRFSITENAYQDPTVIGTADYSQLQNDAGVLATWDLNRLLLKLGYDHAGYNTLTGGLGMPDGSSDTVNCSVGWLFRPELTAGLESGGGFVDYSGPGTAITRAMDWNVGGFVQGRPMEHISARAAAGYTAYSAEGLSGQSPGNGFNGAYARLVLNHQLNQWFEYSLNAGRNVSFGFFGGTIDLCNADLSARWHIFQKLGLGTWFEFERGSQVLAGHERFERFGPGVSLDQSLGPKLSGSIRYQYYRRSSDRAGGDYFVNIVTVSLVVRL